MKVEILVSCHKPTDAVQNACIKTIQVGTALALNRLDTAYHDDEGRNISEKNRNYCELTAQYWAWKNLDADFYGFFHYRRYLTFRHVDRAYDCWGNLPEEFIDTACAEKYGLDEDTIKTVLTDCDVVLPEIKDITKMLRMGSNMREQFLGSGALHAKDLELMNRIIEEKYPEYLPYAEKYEEGHLTVFNNMFIMRRDIFHDYCAWLFDILEEYSRRADMTDYSVEALRTPGHLAERLLNIYCLHLRDKTNCRFRYFQTVVFEETDPLPQLHPAFNKKNVAIALLANDFYTPYVGVLLLSLLGHCSEENNYDIIVLNKDISKKNQNGLRALLQDRKNASLRFLNVKRFESQFANLFLREHFVMETYFRLLLPELLPEYKKILYLDCDTIVQADLAELFHEDVEGYMLAACHDADTAGLYNGYEPQKKNYMDTILKIKEPYNYFQAGVILFNLEAFRQKYTTVEMVRFAASYKWELLDQDVLNYLCQGHVKYVDMSWNSMTDWLGIRISDIVSRAPKWLLDDYMAARAEPKIIHYAGPEKPWQQPDSDYAGVFWKYARMSPYYELLLQRLARQEALKSLPAGLKTRVRRKIVRTAKKIGNFLFPHYTKRRKFIKVLLKRE